jgi:serine/threonine-protein kinase
VLLAIARERRHIQGIPFQGPTVTDVTGSILGDALRDRYRLDRELGQGGMATVFLAHDLHNNRPVALKVLRPELAAILGAERFLKEIETTANLQHPHILPLFDSGQAGTLLFYVMPYVEGESLRDRLSREKQLPIADAVRIASEVASALDYAHRHGVLHRDIKPENILLHDGQALVADFGIALAMRKAGGTRLTETGLSLGTPQYMSPEQATAERELDARTDIYALGAVTYEMLTGEAPFTGTTTQAIIAKLMTEVPRPPSVLRKAVPEAIERAVLTALEKLPADRFARAAQFANALTSLSATQAHPTPAQPVARTPGRWRAFALGATSMAVAAGLLAAWGWLRPPSRPVSRYRLALPTTQAIQQGALGVNLAISPDGASMVYLGPGEGGGQLWLRERDRLDATPIPGTTGH